MPSVDALLSILDPIEHFFLGCLFARVYTLHAGTTGNNPPGISQWDLCNPMGMVYYSPTVIQQ